MVKKLTLNDFIKGVKIIDNSKIKSVAPLGMSSDTVYLSGNNRVSEVSLRKYNNSCELLITDENGTFLTYSKLHLSLSIDYISQKWFDLYKELEPLINTSIDDYNIELSNNYKLSNGFELLQKTKKENDYGIR